MHDALRQLNNLGFAVMAGLVPAIGVLDTE
jgi:hypothetical protein